MKTKATYL